MRPTERAPQDVTPLRDSEVADWLDAHQRAALLFWDAEDPVSQRQRAKLEVVAASAGIPVAVVDVATDPLVARALGVKSVPLILVFHAGEVVDRLIGAVPEAILLGALRPPEPHRAG